MTICRQLYWTHPVGAAMRTKTCLQFLLALALLTSVACQSSYSRPDEAYAVYSAYLESQMRHNAHDYGTGGGVLLIQQMTSTLELQADVVPRIAENLKGVEASTLTNFRQVVRESGVLEREFSLPTTYVITSQTDIASGKVKGDYGYLALSRVGFNRNGTQALFHVDHFCGLCGGSGYVLMKKNIFGTWKMQREFFTIVS
jgi:hypothetical protein